MRRAVRLSAGLACALVVTVVGAQELTRVSTLPGDPFPLRDLAGREWSRADLAGKVVLVDFWATWCTPCIGELPHLRRAYERHRADGFEILAVSVDQTDKGALLRWIRSHQVSWPQLHDNRGFGGDLPLTFEVDLVPRSFLFDRAGRLVATDLRGDAFEAAVAALARLPAPAAGTSK